MGAKAAKLRARELIGLVAQGRDPQAEHRANRGGVTFKELQKRYVDEYAKRHNKSWAQANSLMISKVLPIWGNLKAAEITRVRVKQLVGELSANTPSLANSVLAAISAVFTFAVDEEIVAVHPCTGVRGNPTNDRDRFLSKTEVALFWKACDSFHPVRAAALRTILLTGQRPGEVAHMRWEHIRDGWWNMPGDPVPESKWPGTKNGESHRVWLSAKVQELIADLGSGANGFVFAEESGKSARNNLGHAMRDISKVCAFDSPVRPHDLRRTAATMITARRHGLEAMSRVLNHLKRGVSRVYNHHHYETEDKFIMEDIASAFMEAVDGSEANNVIAAEFRRAW